MPMYITNELSASVYLLHYKGWGARTARKEIIHELSNGLNTAMLVQVSRDDDGRLKTKFDQDFDLKITKSLIIHVNDVRQVTHFETISGVKTELEKPTPLSAATNTAKDKDNNDQDGGRNIIEFPLSPERRLF